MNEFSKLGPNIKNGYLVIQWENNLESRDKQGSGSMHRPVS